MMVRRLKRRRSLLAWIALLIFMALVAARLLDVLYRPAPVESLNRDVYRVRRVIDGDTLVLTNGSRIRLIGVDTPELNSSDAETVRLARQAADYTRQFVRGGEVRLEFDRERLDRYGRFLAYVYVGEAMLNEQLIRQGYGRAMMQFHYRFKPLFRDAQDEARQARLRIWSSDEFVERK